MTIEARPADPATLRGTRPRDVIAAHWPLLAGFLLMAVPTIVRLGQQTWATETGAHGPIVLATGLWLLSYNGLKFGAVQRFPALVWAALAGVWAVYAFGRAYDFISLEALALYLTFIIGLFMLAGRDEVKRNLFPLFYLAFMVPPPGWVMDQLTSPLRSFASYAAVSVLQPLGYPIAREGIALTIAQYQLLVEDACAGMNSLTGLTAISLFYIYLMHRASWRYALVLVALIIPVAVIVNIIRVIALVLITFYYGDAAAQGFLHVTTGLVLFTLAIALMFAIDMAMQAVLRQRKAAA